MKTQDLKVERVAIDSLKPYPRNARTHSPAQIDAIAASITEFGWTNPVLVDPKLNIIAGHGRVEAARKLGHADVQVIRLKGLTKAQIKALVIADNQIALRAGWDDALLRLELGELKAEGFNLDAIGFDTSALDSLLNPAADPAPAGPGLNERFGVAPFSVLNAREGWWQDRKRAWLALGIKSEVGRGENLLKFSDTINEPDPAKRGRKADAKPVGATGGSGTTYGARGQKGGMMAKAKAKFAERAAVEKGAIVAGNGWGNGGPARRDAAFYSKKRAWEKQNGRKISTTEFREKFWDGAARPTA